MLKGKKAFLLLCASILFIIVPMSIVFFQGLKEKVQLKPSPVQALENPENIETAICDGTLTNAGMSILLNNSSKDYVLQYGEDFGLQQLVDGVWFESPLANKDGKNVIAIAYSVLPMESKKWEVNWGFDYGTLKAGHYRVIKQVDLYNKEEFAQDRIDYRDMKTKYYIAVEFDIE